MKLRSLLISLVTALAPLTLFAASGGTAIPGGEVNAPFTITKSGYYYLTGNRLITTTSKPAIEIKCADVTLDLNGNTVGQKVAAGSLESVIIRIVDTENVEIRNGSITGASGRSIAAETLSGGGSLKVTQVRFAGCVYGVAASGIGSLYITDCTFDGSGSTVVYAENLSESLNVLNSRFTGNGDIQTYNSSFMIKGCSFVSKYAILQSYGSGSGLFTENHVVSSLKSGFWQSSLMLSFPVDVTHNVFVMKDSGGALKMSGGGLVEANVFRGGTAISSPNNNLLIVNNRYTAGTSIKYSASANKFPVGNLQIP